MLSRTCGDATGQVLEEKLSKRGGASGQSFQARLCTQALRNHAFMLFFGGHATFVNCFAGACFADRSMKFLEISWRSEVRHPFGDASVAMQPVDTM